MSADSGVTRDAFLKRIRAGLGRKAASPGALNVPEDLVRRVSPDADLAAIFEERACAAGVTVHRCAPEEVGKLTAQLVTKQSRVAIELACDALREDVLATFDEQGIPCREGLSLEDHYDTDIAITEVVAAVAETGSILVQSGPDRSRGAPLLPCIHVAFVREAQIVPDLTDVWEHFEEDAAYSVLITGPSKTADIESILITGVHGPGELHVMLIRSE